MVMGTWSLRVETPLGLASPHLFLRARWGENEEVPLPHVCSGCSRLLYRREGSFRVW